MEFVQALIQELGVIESKAGETTTLSNPGSCPVCNHCDGWEGNSTKPKGNTIVIEKWPSPPFSLKTNIQNLISSANNGCSTCGIFRDAIAHFLPALERNFEVEAWLPMRPSLPQLRVKPEGLAGDEGGDQFEFFTTPEFVHLSVTSRANQLNYGFQDAPAPWTLFRPGKVVPGDTSSRASLQQALKWLQDCSENHTQCRLFCKSKSELPTRVLDVGLSDSQAENVRLHETNGQVGRYVALSHCWGKSQMLKTEHRSLLQHKKGISWSVLPHTFQDAVTFVRRIGVRYIWIDSLCIIQDDSTDWERESAKMASIYTNSFLTIVATKSADSKEGCFAVTPERDRTHKITGFDVTGMPFAIYARPTVRHTDNAERKTLFPIAYRAWCYQEQVLSPRLLHFHYCELKWECTEKTACECSVADGTPHDKQDHAKALIEGSDPHSLNNRWRRMIRVYVDLNLTYECDRLPALSGIAKQMLSIRNGKYLAGLWEDSFFEDMMWWVTEESSLHTRRPKEWRAPSWSWASLEGRIEHRIYPIKNTHCKINEVDIIPAGDDPTGAVASGRLVASGILMPAILRYIRPKSDAEELEPDKRRFGIEIAKRSLPHKIYVDYPLDQEGPYYVPDGQNVHCLCIATDQWHTCWLVLRRVRYVEVEVKVEAYERIGMAKEKNTEIEEQGSWAKVAKENVVVVIV